MKVYLVGGAVRNTLLSLPIEERDWVVVGSTPEEMLAQGFKPVGKDFPVFLHPETYEEYALARTERKTRKGYQGFQFNTDRSVTLEEDLKRRDLTINAIAESKTGELVDPFGGQKDIEKRVLRHVSSSFVEDPVRVLRVARFAARFHLLGFRVANETLVLMRQMVESGEVDALVKERVWQEFETALGESNPEQFILVLRQCDALAKIFPELDNNTTETLQQAVRQTEDKIVRFAALTFEIKNLAAFCRHICAPRAYADLAKLVTKHYSAYQQLKKADAKDIYELLEKLDTFRQPKRLEQFLQACIAIEGLDFSKKIKKAFVAANAVRASHVKNPHLSGKELGEAIRQLRIREIQNAL